MAGRVPPILAFQKPLKQTLYIHINNRIYGFFAKFYALTRPSTFVNFPQL